MRTPSLATGLALLAATTLATAQPQPSGPITTAEAAMRYHQNLMSRLPPPRLWTPAPRPPCQAARPMAPGASADAQLNQMVRTHNRTMLDRGAWVNPWSASVQAPSCPADTACVAQAAPPQAGRQ